MDSSGAARLGDRAFVVYLLMLGLAFAAGASWSSFVFPWLRGADRRPLPVSACSARVDRIAAELAAVRRDCGLGAR
jgi:hypothetical protein